MTILVWDVEDWDASLRFGMTDCFFVWGGWARSALAAWDWICDLLIYNLRLKTNSFTHHFYIFKRQECRLSLTLYEDDRVETLSSQTPLARICNPCYDLMARIATKVQRPKEDKPPPPKKNEPVIPKRSEESQTSTCKTKIVIPTRH